MSKNWQRPTRRDALLGDREGAYAIARHIRMSPQKVRRVVDLVRGMPVGDALDTLRFAPQAASEPVYKVIASAVANAENAENLRANDLYVSQIFVDEGVTMRRWKARAKGQGARIMKRASHITAVVEPLAGKGEPIPVSTQAVTKRFDAAPKPAARAAAGEKPAEKPAKTAEKPTTTVDDQAEVELALDDEQTTLEDLMIEDGDDEAELDEAEAEEADEDADEADEAEDDAADDDSDTKEA